jgi:hypothetical protein
VIIVNVPLPSRAASCRANFGFAGSMIVDRLEVGEYSWLIIDPVSNVYCTAGSYDFLPFFLSPARRFV